MSRPRATLAFMVMVGVVAYLTARDRLEPVGSRWAIGRSPFSDSEQTLYRVGDHPFFSRTRVDGSIAAYRFYPPDCVLYTSSALKRRRTNYAVCGDRSPIMAAAGDYEMTALGLEQTYRSDSVNGVLMINGARIPIGRIKTYAKKARPFDPDFLARFERGWALIPMRNYRFPENTEWPDSRESTVLHDAVASSNVDLVSDLLSKGIHPDLRGPSGVTPLMVATFANTPDATAIVTALLEAGADPDAQTSTGMTALMFAVRAGSSESARRIIRAGADTLLRNSDGQRAGELKPVR
jgi:hypothetical protein